MPMCFVALGSNIDPKENLKRAVTLLRESFDDTTVASVYESSSLLKDDQEDYLNTVVRIETSLTPEEVHSILQSIEKELGKSVEYTWGPRTIDLDLLLYEDSILPTREEWSDQRPAIRDQRLFIPHPRMHDRPFVLEPLCELIDVSTLHPTLNESWESLREKCSDGNCRKIESQP